MKAFRDWDLACKINAAILLFLLVAGGLIGGVLYWRRRRRRSWRSPSNCCARMKRSRKP